MPHGPLRMSSPKDTSALGYFIQIGRKPSCLVKDTSHTVVWHMSSVELKLLNDKKSLTLLLRLGSSESRSMDGYFGSKERKRGELAFSRANSLLVNHSESG